jgi:glycosyltransferase involved in cell wall biosynthesis
MNNYTQRGSGSSGYIKELRVLHLDTGRDMRGGQWQLDRLVRGLAQRGFDSLILAPESSPLHSRDLPTAPLSILRLRREPCDLIHAHDSRGHSFALWAKAPVVVSRRVAFRRQPNALSRWKYATARRFLAVSEFVRRGLIAEGVAPDKIAVVHDGVPLLAPSERRPGEVVAIEKAACLEEALKTASVCSYISEMEGLGSAALLAQSAGVPVVALRVGGLPEAVEHGVTGLLAGRPEEVPALVRSLIEDPQRLEQFSRAARARIEREFTVEKMLTRTVAEYERALA